MTADFTSRFERPSRPLPISLLNAVGARRCKDRIGAPAGRGFAPPGPRARRLGFASSATSLSVEPLSLLDRLAGERGAPFRRWDDIIQRRRFVDALVNRLRVHQLLDEPTPRSRTIPLDRVARHCRSAANRHDDTAPAPRLECRDARSLASWEAVNPAPFPGENARAPHGTHAMLARRAEQGLQLPGAPILRHPSGRARCAGRGRAPSRSPLHEPVRRGDDARSELRDVARGVRTIGPPTNTWPH